MSDLLPKGTALPAHYVLEGAVGSGRVRTVYAAHDAENRRAAASVLHTELVDALGEWFENSAILGRTLDHPGVVKTLAVGHVGERPVVITELLEGETLAEILGSRTTAMAVAEVSRIITQLAAALDYLHERSPIIVHRALTPENVFLADPDARVKLLEVGSHDRPGFAPSRPPHRSPEELAGITDLSARADVFSLASLAYELLTGQPAFSGDAGAVLDAIRSGQRARVSDNREEISARVDEVLLRAWSLSPEARQQSAGAFARAFAEALSEASEPAAPRHSQRVPVGTSPAHHDDAPTGRVRTSHSPENVNPMEEFPTVKLMVGADGTVVVTSAVGPSPNARASGTPGAASAAPARPPVTPKPMSQPFRVMPRVGPKPAIAAPSAPIAPPKSPLPPAPDKDPTARDIHQHGASDAVIVDDPTPAFDAIVAVEPTPTAVVHTVPPTASSEPETPSIVVAPSATTSAAPAPVSPPTLVTPPTPALVAPSAPLPPTHPSPAPVPTPAPSTPPVTASHSVSQPAPKPPTVSTPPSPSESRSWPAVAPESPPKPARSIGALPGFAHEDEPTEAYTFPPPRSPAPNTPDAPTDRSPERPIDRSFDRNPDRTPDRSYIVMAAAFIANAILIVGIAHALAWGTRTHVAPMVIAGPAPICAPCAACPPPPPAPECPATIAPPRPLGPAGLLRPTAPIVRPENAPMVRPPLARPAIAPRAPFVPRPLPARPPVAGARPPAAPAAAPVPLLP